MKGVSRLSDQNIEDVVFRALYYQEVLAFVDEGGNTELTTYEIKVDEEYRPDLAAYRATGTADLAWLICLVSDVADPIDGLPVGEEIYLPSPAWIRSSMRAFIDKHGL
ncbi:MAG: baseplate protein [Phycisphaeraceae bacterium]|nr:baseplate protein [Phycisphaeraceae bacterium]|tara:strand:+ start:12124 stop:12447 length:324 start_codon:yes stop_codon:yes gene_type:complete